MTLETMRQLSIAMVLAPLLGCLIAGLAGKKIGPKGAHTVTIAGVGASFALAACLAKAVLFGHAPIFNQAIYTWAVSGSLQIDVGFLIDQLSAIMLVVVTFISLLVHIYSIGYMAGDGGYQRFFSYISLFTFAMLLLVLANNFMLLFVGWEGVGLASYLLIGFWFNRESANQGSMKAFLVNRVGDFGFVLGIALVLAYFGTLNYAPVFAQASDLVGSTISIIPGHEWSVLTVICILLFVGAMGKSAQVPLHVWLPESMEGPTPISALIHAATMVTAGIYMVSRMSPLFSLSTTALSVVLVVGATGALFMGLLGIVQNDIKRVVAYSTLSQLGYMIAALGASAYAAGMFHLVTHAFFKALLFLGAGSVIIAMHHDQDLRHMGGLRKYMPITYVTCLLGSLALAGIPPFAGFYSKDAIIEAIHLSGIAGSHYAYYCVVIGVFVTAVYTFRAFLMTFHTQERMDQHTREHLKESPWVVTLPLILLAIPSVVLGYFMIGPALFAEHSLFGQTIVVPAAHNPLLQMAEEYHGPAAMMLHALHTVPFWLAIAGTLTAWLSYQKMTFLPAWFARRFSWIYRILVAKYGFDEFNRIVFAGGARGLGQVLYKVGDVKIIDGIVNGIGRVTTCVSSCARRVQTGYLYHYALAMVLGLMGFLALMLWGS